MLDTDSAATPDWAIWDETTGETWGEARARFATIGPLLTAQEALDYIDSADYLDEWPMSFGYGDDPEGFTTVDPVELRESIDEDGSEAVTGYWGPFAFWVTK